MYTEEALIQFLDRFGDHKRNQMMDVFVTSFEKLKANSKTAMADNSLHDLASCMHDIKSLCLTLGDADFGALAESLEFALKTDGGTVSFCQVDVLLRQVDDIVAVIRQYQLKSS